MLYSLYPELSRLHEAVSEKCILDGELAILVNGLNLRWFIQCNIWNVQCQGSSGSRYLRVCETIRRQGSVSVKHDRTEREHPSERRDLPIRLRPTLFEKSRYQIFAGHNRIAVSKLAGRKTVPAIIIQATDDEAKLIMINSNLCQ